jgi:cell shape-determining protein MreC
MYREPFVSCNSSRCAKPRISFKPGIEYMKQEYKRLSEENTRLKEQLSMMQLQQEERQAN